MKNFKTSGESVRVAVPYNRLSGEAFIIGSLFLVSPIDALLVNSLGVADFVEGAATGIFSLKKLSTDVVAVGDKLCWNNTTKQLQKATSDLDNVATATKVAGNGALVVECRLTPL